jgi:hypothetical protein
VIEILPRWPPPAAPAPPAPASARVAGQRPAPAAQDRDGEQRAPTLGAFSAALARAGILDNTVVDLAGSVVALPYGVALLHRFRDRVHAIYRAHGLEEHEYPELVPASALLPVEELFDLSGKILHVGASPGATGEPGLALLPTGEAAIYGHWAKSVRNRGDLPIRAYRRARYFRPVSRGRHAGRGLFYAMEHDDIFEFHCAYESCDELRGELRRHWKVLRTVLEAMHVPALWSTRPPWTNRQEVADWAVAADVPLPTLATTQVASLYNQGTRFSEPFGIGFREHGEMHHTFQLSGYVSRRLLLVHLLLGMRPSGRFFLHPDLAPVQVAVLLRAAREPDVLAGEALVQQLGAEGVRAQLTALDRPARVAAALESWSARGAPIVAMLFGAAEPGEPFRVVLRRSDSEQEAELPAGTDGLALTCRCLLGEIAAGWRRHVELFVAGRVVEVADADATREATGERLVAVCPLAVGEDTVREIGTWGTGEVLGFCGAREARPCVLTGRPTDAVALVSPRT